MEAWQDPEFRWLVGGLLGFLLTATLLGQLPRLGSGSEGRKATIQNINERILTWWLIVGLVIGALLAGPLGATALFAGVSFLALREFLPLLHSRETDRPAIYWLLWIVLPVHYVLVAINWYGFFTVFIPVYAFLLLPFRSALGGETSGYLERTATVQWALMICVYCLSHVPAILMLEIPGYVGQDAKLLLYLVIVVELGDVFAFVWGKLLGRHKIAPVVSPNKTWEGFLGGALSATAIGVLLDWATPFHFWEAAALSAVVAILGFAGDLVLSAIKRDRGIKDYGSSLLGHGGILDRVDSLAFAAPVFFHLVRFFYS